MTISATDIVVPVCSKMPLLYLLTQKVAQKFGYVLGIKKDDLVRIIEGPFTGVVGRVGRAAGQQRVFVVLEGLCNVATAYIPNDFIQSIDTFTR